jgi:thiamine-monophosphate kinase
MKQLENILENQNIGELAHQFSRSSQQLNQLHETDSELIDIKGNESDYLAITIDTISDEIAEGLYKDPFTMGWVTVMANLSDLAAVGANPIGIVTAVSLEKSREKTFRNRIAQGIEEACRKAGTFILGGDLNITRSISLTGCAIGTVPKTRELTRIGLKEGDVLYLSGKAGGGNALGLTRKINLPEEMYPEKTYRPIARIKEGQLIGKFASSCMDTSDGLFITIDQLIRLNDRGCSIVANWEQILEKGVYQLCTKLDIPYWFMAAGIHGEFELVFTVPYKNVSPFLEQAQKMDFHPISLGKIIDTPRFEITQKSQKTAVIDMTPLRNLWTDIPGNMSYIIEKHYTFGQKWGLNQPSSKFKGL